MTGRPVERQRLALPRRLLAGAALLAALAAAPCSPQASHPAQGRPAEPVQPAPAGTADLRAPRPGVTTHFSQGWPLRLMNHAAALGVGTIRDSVAWPRVEREAGHFAFTPANSGHVDRACALGMTVLLGLEPRHPLYDGGQTVHSAGGQAAFARYVRALAERWPHCVIAVEIGNEINGRGGMTGPAASNRIAAHVALLRAVWEAVKPDHPGLALLGGSTNTVATGFLARLFAAGALRWSDGIAVPPYRPEPEGLDRELARLRAAMRQAGGPERAIWVTEFSRDFPDQAAAPGYYLKSVALMESAGVTHHFWYALADQPAFPTMGLLRLDGTAKPAAVAFAFAARTLAPLGPARRVDHGDPALFDLRFGTDTHVVWGAPRSMTLPATARAFAADGRPLPLPAMVSEQPVVIRGPAAIAFGPGRVLADSFYGHGAAPFAWFARRADGALLPLAPVNWAWTSYLGTPALPQFAANQGGIGTVPGAGTLVRYTQPPGAGGADAPTPATAALCLRPAGGTAGGRARAALTLRGQVLWQAPLGPVGVQAAVPVTLSAGDRLDLVVMPEAGAPPARWRYRLRLWRGAGQAVSC